MLIPAQIWVGSAQVLEHKVEQFLQQRFCSNAVCGRCIICKQILIHEYQHLLWLKPEGQYKIEQLKEVSERLALSLAAGEEFYFVFTDAHCLNITSANSLLKSVEEPPLGYHFIFLTPRIDLLLTTLVSRCIVQRYENSVQLRHPLVNLFTNDQSWLNPIQFTLLLEKNKELNDRDSRELFDQIHHFWLQNRVASFSTSSQIVRQRLDLLQSQLDQPPMPGSTKLFWKNLYLMWPL